MRVLCEIIFQKNLYKLVPYKCEFCNEKFAQRAHFSTELGHCYGTFFLLQITEKYISVKCLKEFYGGGGAVNCHKGTYKSHLIKNGR